MSAKPPGLKWILILGAAGFAAGFLGPMIFVPEANQGPLVGILISGPAGVVVGLAFYASCALLKLPARLQWRMLHAVAAVGVLVTLLYVQPDPKLLGYVFDGEVQSCESPLEAEESVVAHWDERIAKVSWAQPRAGWRQDMHSQLGDAPGVVLSVRLLRQNAIYENRKPWNRGSQTASGWIAKTDETFFYDAANGCDRYPDGSELRGFQQHDYEERLQAAKAWPPTQLLSVLGASSLDPVPPRWAGL